MGRRKSPISSIITGLLAGTLGALAQSVFFKASSKISPKPPSDAFEPPEPRQKFEGATETVARRFVTGFMQRRPPTSDGIAKGGQIVHFGFGALWGLVYVVARETLQRRPNALEVLGYGALVWMISDNVILPSFKLAAWPQAYPLKSHAYAVAAHFVYAGAVYRGYELFRDRAAMRRLLRAPSRRRAPRVLRRANARVRALYASAVA